MSKAKEESGVWGEGEKWTEKTVPCSFILISHFFIMLATIVIVTSHFDSNSSKYSTVFLRIVALLLLWSRKYDVAEISTTRIITFRDFCRLPPIKLIKLAEFYPHTHTHTICCCSFYHFFFQQKWAWYGQNKVIHCVRNAFSDFIYFIIIWFYAMPKRIRNQKQKFTTAINVSSYILWEFFFYRHYREFREVDFSHLSLSFIYFCFQLKSSFIA